MNKGALTIFVARQGLKQLACCSAPLVQRLQHLQLHQQQHRKSSTLRAPAAPAAAALPVESPAPAPLKLDPAILYNNLRKVGIEYFCGVPDSLLKDFCSYVIHNSNQGDHVIACNEGAAVGLASGYHLATGRTACVYLQNSGLGNMVNPLMSLSNPTVYSIPMLLMVGWRGEPGVKDEPQHLAQGDVTPNLIECMNIPCEILPNDEDEMKELLDRARRHFAEKRSPFAILVKSKTFSPYAYRRHTEEQFSLTREQALQHVMSYISDDSATVGTTGMLSRELFEYRVSKEMGHSRDFLTVGSMGHASAIALAIAFQRPNKQVYCLDGDGAAIMHMGTMATIGQKAPRNFKHIVFNNGAHDSVGGHPTEASNHASFDLCAIAKGCGYKEALTASTPEEIKEKVTYLKNKPGPILLELKIKLGNRSDLGRPTRTTHQNKDDFMGFLMS